MKGDILGSHFFWKTDCDVDTNDHKSTGVVGKAPLPQVVRMGKYADRNPAAQMAIVMQVSRQESRSTAGPDHVTLQALITWLIKYRSRD